MAIDVEALQAAVQAEVPWHPAGTVAGTLRIRTDNLVVEPHVAGEARVDIPLASISRASVESTLGVLPALRVWHRTGGVEQESRFLFSSDPNRDRAAQDDGGPGLSDRIGPGVARDAAQALESGFRVLSGGLSRGRRTARQAVEGLARHEEYQQWPAAIAQAQRQARGTPGHGAADTSAAAPEPIVPPDAQPPVAGANQQLAWFLSMVPAWLAACGKRARDLGVRGVPVIQPAYPLDSETCRIVVVGEFSRGKSTLINALFGIRGEIALPTGMTPTTPIACALRVPRVGEADGATISYRTRRSHLELTLDEFRRAVRLADGGTSASGQDAAKDPHLHEARRVEVRVTGAYLPSGVEIEDTPGLNEQAGRSAGALAALGRADLILFVLAADQLLGDPEREIIFDVLLREHHRNVLFLVNFWDSVEDERERENLRTRAKTILSDFPSPFRGGVAGAGSGQTLADVYFISALQAARAQRQRELAPDESGIPLLRARLRELLGPEWQSMVLRARAGRARRFIRILRDLVSRAVAGGTSESPASARSVPPTHDSREAVAAATRVASGLPDAMLGATSRLQVGLERGTVSPLDQLAVRLAAPPSEALRQSDDELRRSLLAALRVVASDYARAAQDALDLVVARMRATFLERRLAPPVFDLHVGPVVFTAPAGAEPAALLEVLRDMPRLLRDDLERQAAALTTSLTAVCEESLHTGDGFGRGPRDEQPGQTDAASDARILALRQLEDDLVRLDQVLSRMT